METAGGGREGVCVTCSPGEPCMCVGGVRGIFRRCLSWCSLWLTVGICPLQGVISGKYSEQPHVRCTLTKRTELCTIPSPPLMSVSVYWAGEAVKATTLQCVSCFIAFYTSVTQMHVWFLTPLMQNWLVGGQWVRAFGILPWTRRPGPKGGAYQNWAVFFCSLAFMYVILPLILLGEKFHPKMLPTATKQWVRIVCTVCLVFIF